MRSAHVDFMHAHAHAENLHVHAHVNGVAQCQPWKSPRFGEEISAEACSGKEIAGLLRKMIMMMNMMTRKL